MAGGATIAAALIAAVVTTAITRALVESMDPANLVRREAGDEASPAVALVRRDSARLS